MSINRFAEAMTIFAVMCAGIFPLFHTGRPWVAYWLFPIPNWLAMWPQFRSPLEWDVWAVSTYFTVSVLFWYMGLIPDLAKMRDRAKTQLSRTLNGIFALGWRNSAIHWMRWEQAYLLLAGLSTPLVLSVHSIVSLDFAISIVPGWHVTIFPPYFVAGAIFSGFAMVLTLVIPFRILYPPLKDYITMHHIDMMAKVMLATGWIVFYGYLCEMFFGLVQRQPVRAVLGGEPLLRSLLAGVLGADFLQRDYSAAALVTQDSAEPIGTVHHLDYRECRHVVRAVRDCGNEPASRLLPVGVGHVYADDQRLVALSWHDWLLCDDDVRVRAVYSDAGGRRAEGAMVQALSRA
jgi:hypothetical protein